MTKAINLSVVVTRKQVVTYKGKSLGSVQVVGSDLKVNRRRPRQGKFETFYYPLRGSSYIEGDGGVESTAYATVLDEVVVVSVQGMGVIDEEVVRITNDEGTHTINRLSDGLVTIVEIADSEDKPVRKVGNRTQRI